MNSLVPSWEQGIHKEQLFPSATLWSVCRETPSGPMSPVTGKASLSILGFCELSHNTVSFILAFLVIASLFVVVIVIPFPYFTIHWKLAKEKWS